MALVAELPNLPKAARDSSPRGLVLALADIDRGIYDAAMTLSAIDKAGELLTSEQILAMVNSANARLTALGSLVGIVERHLDEAALALHPGEAA
jgi:hypothetical protein